MVSRQYEFHHRIDQQTQAVVDAIGSFFDEWFSYTMWQSMNNISLSDSEFRLKMLSYLQRELGNKTGSLLFDALFEE